MYPPTQFRRQGVLCSPSTRLTARGALALLAMIALAGCERDSTAPLTPPTRETDLLSNSTDPGGPAMATTLGGPIAGLTPEELARFEAGREDFQEIETVEDGLGPVFNEAGCVDCHDAPIGGTNGRLETRFGKWEQGKFDPLDRFGGSLMQDQAIGKVRTDRDPAGDPPGSSRSYPRSCRDERTRPLSETPRRSSVLDWWTPSPTRR